MRRRHVCVSPRRTSIDDILGHGGGRTVGIPGGQQVEHRRQPALRVISGEQPRRRWVAGETQADATSRSPGLLRILGQATLQDTDDETLAGSRPASAAAVRTNRTASPPCSGDIRVRITPSAIRPAKASVLGCNGAR